MRLGPRAVSADRTQIELLEAAGFIEIGQRDVTPGFLRTAQRWLRFARDLETSLRAALGDESFDEQQADRAATIEAVQEGLLSRAMLIGTAPPSSRRSTTFHA